MKQRVTIYTTYGDLDPLDFHKFETACDFVEQCAKGLGNDYDGHKIDEIADDDAKEEIR